MPKFADKSGTRPEKSLEVGLLPKYTTLLSAIILALSALACSVGLPGESDGEEASKAPSSSGDAVSIAGSVIFECDCDDMIPPAMRPKFPRVANVTKSRHLRCSYLPPAGSTNGRRLSVAVKSVQAEPFERQKKVHFSSATRVDESVDHNLAEGPVSVAIGQVDGAAMRLGFLHTDGAKLAVETSENLGADAGSDIGFPDYLRAVAKNARRTCR